MRRTFITFVGWISPCAIHQRNSPRARRWASSAQADPCTSRPACVGGWRKRLSTLRILGFFLTLCHAAAAQSLDALVRAYPEELAAIDDENVIWRDGTRLPLGAHDTPEDLAQLLRHASIRDQFLWSYPKGETLGEPGADPGRIRNRAFFDKMYGNCERGEVAPKLVPVIWLPNTWGHSLEITSVNGVAEQLTAVSRELDALPPDMKRPLYPPGGTYTCRAVRDTGQPSMHGWGAAIDINPSASSYWLWGHKKSHEIAPEIIAIFESHGFIWGGKWAHFDTMHFEYRPELLLP